MDESALRYLGVDVGRNCRLARNQAAQQSAKGLAPVDVRVVRCCFNQLLKLQMAVHEWDLALESKRLSHPGPELCRATVTVDANIDAFSGINSRDLVSQTWSVRVTTSGDDSVCATEVVVAGRSQPRLRRIEPTRLSSLLTRARLNRSDQALRP